MATASTILLADDYPDALSAWELYLRGAGFDVLTAADGLEALSRATQALPDLAVIDLGMPGVSGFEVASVLRSRDDTREIPLIASTGYSHAPQLEEARRCGFDTVLVKPCDPEVLVGEIRRLLAGRVSRRSTSV